MLCRDKRVSAMSAKEGRYMTEQKKFRLVMFFAVMLTALVILHNVANEYFFTDMEGYFKRRLYYERTISKKGLSEQKGMYWREQE